jgi:hypothetical protein
MLRTDGFLAAALADDTFFRVQTRHQIGDGTLITIKARGVGLDLSFERSPGML